MLFWKKEGSCTFCVYLYFLHTTSQTCVWYFKVYYLPLLICLHCLVEFSWCLLASLHVSKNTNFRATRFNEKRCREEIVAVCCATNKQCMLNVQHFSATLLYHMLELCLLECFLTCSFCFFMLPWIQREVNYFHFSIFVFILPACTGKCCIGLLVSVNRSSISVSKFISVTFLIRC